MMNQQAPSIHLDTGLEIGYGRPLARFGQAVTLTGGTHFLLARNGRVEFEKFLKRAGGEQKSECYIPATVGDLVTSGQAKCKVLRSGDSWFGVTYREDRPMVVESIRKLIAKGDYPEKLWA